MKNKNVSKAFAQGEQAKTKNLFIEGDVIYSYGYHFPLCLRLNNGFVINSDGYSQTTARHKGEIVRAISEFMNFAELEKAYKNNEVNGILLKDTDYIKELIYKNVKTLEEAKHLLTIQALGINSKWNK